MTENQPKLNRQYKDRLFRFLFREKEDLLSLYNAINGTSYTDPEDLEVHTLDDVIYMNMKNDISFLIDNRINLYEEQSSWNPNMPLRGLFYFSKLYLGYVAEKNMSIYSSAKLKLPFPQFVVFYIGQEQKFSRKTLRLSDSFTVIDGLTPCIECTADVINIRTGHNEELLNSCQKLSGYSFLVCATQKYLTQEYSPLSAINLAIELCLEKGVLVDFLKRYRAEVTDMILTEYNEERHMEMVKKEGEELGMERGIKQGKELGKNQINHLNAKLIDLNRFDDLKRAARDPEFQKQLLQEFHIEEED